MMIKQTASIRQVVKAKDIQTFLGIKERQSYKIMRKLRNHFHKKKHQPITVLEFCEYYKVKLTEIQTSIKQVDGIYAL